MKIMSEHEKDLLAITSVFFLIALIGILIGYLVLGELSVFLKTITNSWLSILIFVGLGCAGSYYELTSLSQALQTLESDDDEWVVNRRDLLGMCIGLLISIPMLGFIAYGTDKLGLVKASYNITLAGLGFSLMLGMMFVSAIVARVKRQ